MLRKLQFNQFACQWWVQKKTDTYNVTYSKISFPVSYIFCEKTDYLHHFEFPLIFLSITGEKIRGIFHKGYCFVFHVRNIVWLKICIVAIFSEDLLSLTADEIRQQTSPQHLENQRRGIQIAHLHTRVHSVLSDSDFWEIKTLA